MLQNSTKILVPWLDCQGSVQGKRSNLFVTKCRPATGTTQGYIADPFSKITSSHGDIKFGVLIGKHGVIYGIKSQKVSYKNNLPISNDNETDMR